MPSASATEEQKSEWRINKSIWCTDGFIESLAKAHFSK